MCEYCTYFNTLLSPNHALFGLFALFLEEIPSMVRILSKLPTSTYRARLCRQYVSPTRLSKRKLFLRCVLFLKLVPLLSPIPPYFESCDSFFYFWLVQHKLEEVSYIVQWNVKKWTMKCKPLTLKLSS